jgi:hypothetical protein
VTGSRRWVRFGRLVAIVALCMVAGGASSSHRYAETYVARVAVGGDTLALTVDNANGDVAVRAGSQGHIQVVATKRASQRADLERIMLQMAEGSRGLQVRTGVPCGLNNYAIHFQITVPPGTPVTLRTGAGDVRARGTAERVTVVTGGGDVDVCDARDGVDVRTRGGDVAIRNTDGQLRVHTDGGTIQIHAATGQIRADTGGGDIQARDVAGEIDVETGSGTIEYRGWPQGSCRFETGSGDIELRLPADLNVRLELKARNGDLHVGWPVDGQVSPRRVRGTIGRGDTGEILANSGKGDITLRRR